MGLAASQARLLTITSRLHDIELKQQNISNQKMRLANESEEVSNMYTRALDTQRYTFKNTTTNTSRLMTLKNLYTPGSKYQLKTTDGKLVVPSDLYKMYSNLVKVSNDPNAHANRNNNPASTLSENGDLFNAFMDAKYGSITDAANAVMKAAGKSYTWGHGAEQELGAGGGLGTWQAIVNYATSHNANISGLPTLDEVNYYENLFKSFTENAATTTATSTKGGSHTYTQISASNMNQFVELSDSLVNDPNWLTKAIESGEFMLVDASGNEISTASSTDIDTEYDKQAGAIAEAEYNAATNKINRKEKQLDQEARKLDTEYSAMTTEYESIKNIISQNSEKTFTLFS